MPRTALLPRTLLACGLLASGPPLAAQATAGPFEPALAQVRELLGRGEWGKAHKRAERVLRDILREIGAYEAQPGTLARATAFLAVAEAGLGKEEDAAWHLRAARTLDPRLPVEEVAALGEPGARLAALPLRRLGEVPARYQEGAPPAAGAGYQPARPTGEASGDRLAVPCDQLLYSRDRIPPPVEMELVVDARGRVHEPLLPLPPRYPGYAWYLLEQVRQITYTPATSGGQAVASLEKLHIRFPCSRSW